MIKLYASNPLPGGLGRFSIWLLVLCTLFLSACLPDYEGPKQMEYLNRGLVVVPAETGNAVSWRLLGTDDPDIAFNVYRNDERITDIPIFDATFYLDEAGQFEDFYYVKAVVGGVEESASLGATPWTEQFKRLPLSRPEGGVNEDGPYTYSPNDASAADLDGDGQYEIILKWDPSNSKDNSQDGYTGNVYIDAYTLEGELLWRIDLGPNIRAGAHYTQFIVYDLDSDGKAEIAIRTSDGSVDGKGNVIGDPAADHVRREGRVGHILRGPEFLTVFDGLTGEALATVDYIPERGEVTDWGDNYGNRVDRFLAGVAYLDGHKPSLIMSRGYYTRSVIVAWDWRHGKLTHRWTFDSESGDESDLAYSGQGAHSLTVGDVDGDGRDEIVFGAATIDDDGTGLYSTGLCHGDALHLSDMDPNRPGLEIYMVHETPSCYGDHGSEMHDAATGEIIWGRSGEGADIGRGVSFDIDPRYPGHENWSNRGGLVAADGTQISTTSPGQRNFAIFWDGDVLRELLDGTQINKWNYAAGNTTLLLDSSRDDGMSNNGTKANPTLSADLFGDWREEVIWRNSNSEELLIYSSSLPTDRRFVTLMHDGQYRLAIAWQNVGYNQPPHTSFFFGDGMVAPEPNVEIAGKVKTAKLSGFGRENDAVLSWHLKDIHAKKFTLYQDTDDNPKGRKKIARLDGDVRSFVDSETKRDIDYFYWLKISNKHGKNFETAAIKVRLSATDLPVVSLTAEGTQTSIDLSWNTLNIDVAGFEVFKNTDVDPAGRVSVANLTPDVMFWSDVDVAEETSYFYWLNAASASGDVLSSDVVIGQRLPVPSAVLTTTVNGTNVVLDWIIKNIDIRSLEVYRDVDPDPAGRVRIASIAATARTYTDMTAEPGATYYYWIKINKPDGTNTNTNAAEAIVPLP